MSFSYPEMLRIIRSASFNDEMAAELLLELGRHTQTAELAFRVLDIAGHMNSDAKSLEALFQAMANDQPSLPRN